MTHLISTDYRNMLFVDGEPLNQHLTRKEATVLRCIMSHERVAHREFLLNLVYGGRDEPDIKILDVFVTKLRAKLGPHRHAIETVWGRGYCRSPGYALAPDENCIAITVDAKLVEDVVAAGGGDPEELVTRLLKAEYERLWSEAA
jgi:hypothetical protein